MVRPTLIAAALIALAACKNGPSTATDDDNDGLSEEQGDCDDGDAAVHPGATDSVGDGIDQSCDEADGVDADADTYASFASGGDDCDDQAASVHPGATEVPYDAVDQDCSGADRCDVDGDRYASTRCGGDDCDDDVVTVHPGATEVPYDAVDQDCSGADLCDVDGDGHDDPRCGGDDCDDQVASVHPDGVEVPYDGSDQDCDEVDLCDVDGDSFDAVACGGDDCDDDAPNTYPGTDDPPEDGVDQDCDGVDARIVHTIVDVQRGVVPVGGLAKVRDAVVTAVATFTNDVGFGFFAQDPGGGPYSGVWVYLGAGAERFAPGDVVDIIASVQEYDALGAWPGSVTELNVAAGGQVIALGTTLPVPAPAAVSAADLLDAALAEPWEGVLVSVGPAVASANDVAGEFAVDPGLIVGDRLAAPGPVYVGDSFSDLVGVLDYHRGTYKLLPRSADDLTDHQSAVRRADDLAPGELFFTEIMANPGSSCSDTDDEYLELFNASGSAVDLAGLTVRYGTSLWEFRDRAVIAPDSWILLGRERPSPCYEVEPSALFSMPLVNTDLAQALQLTRADGVVIDEAPLTDLPLPTGASLSLSPAALDASANDAPTSWCVATSPIGTSGDAGTPGTPNDPC